jgi:hypothetical protein
MSIVSICGGNAEIDLLALVVGQFVDEARAGKAAGFPRLMEMECVYSRAKADLWRTVAARDGGRMVACPERRRTNSLDTIEYRWADGQNDRLPALAADLVRRQVNVIAAPGSTPAALAAKAATATIPVIFEVGTDPVAAGLVASLARPAGNVTGVTNIDTELVPKRLELLRELIPTANIIALLVNPTSPFITESISKDLQSATRALGLQLHILNASTEHDFDTVFATFTQLRADVLVIAPDAMFISRSELPSAAPAVCDSFCSRISIDGDAVGRQGVAD